jgi:protein SCO1/2
MISGIGRIPRTVLVLALLCALAAPAASAAEPRPDDRANFGGPFSLIASDGSTKTDKSFHGRWVLVYFGYTHCPNICPTTLNAISAALDALGPLADKVQPLYISIDPERDTPTQMGEFTRAYDPRILGLTGTPAAIASVTKEYRVFHRKMPAETPGDYWMEHSSYIYIMDPQGRYVTLIVDPQEPRSITAHLRELIAPSPAATGSAQPPR